MPNAPPSLKAPPLFASLTGKACRSAVWQPFWPNMRAIAPSISCRSTRRGSISPWSNPTIGKNSARASCCSKTWRPTSWRWPRRISAGLCCRRTIGRSSSCRGRSSIATGASLPDLERHDHRGAGGIVGILAEIDIADMTFEEGENLRRRLEGRTIAQDVVARRLSGLAHFVGRVIGGERDDRPVAAHTDHFLGHRIDVPAIGNHPAGQEQVEAVLREGNVMHVADLNQGRIGDQIERLDPLRRESGRVEAENLHLGARPD